MQHDKNAITDSPKDYFYTGEAFATGEKLVLSNLLEILRLASYLGVDGLFDLVQREIAERKLVDPNKLKEGSCIGSIYLVAITHHSNSARMR